MTFPEVQSAVADLGTNGKVPKLVTLAGNVNDALAVAMSLGASEGQSPEQYEACKEALANFASAHSAFAASIAANLPG
jgi:hypothetical protein